ncbi:L,D-transpeptidase family protein [Chitinophaga qingshengii]|uniref:L,D-transpeptidase family protein n=1 Tax=Chitinophaga qingshengii TaxID=1569794 RepID=A0ABR7TT80_9BACT|nr:L,D-transpeptidase family protein [Chitinophaga qingshengii]MBC9933668.1 L,D-transpeptidase family protein [Chitinophaga qingshengii]
MTVRFYTTLSLLALVIFVACQQNGGFRKKLKIRDTTHYTKEAYIEEALDSNVLNKFLATNTNFDQYDEYIRNFYQKRGYHYAWINKDSLTEQAANFINMMKNDASYGIKDSSLINPDLQRLTDSLSQGDAGLHIADTSRPHLEMLLTAQFFAYGNKVWGGLTADSAKDLEWFIPRKKIDMESLLDSVVRKKSNAFEEDEPVNRQYKLLRTALKKLANLEASTKWDTIHLASKATFKKGDSSQSIISIKNKLAALGDLTVNDSSSRFTPELDSAVRSFQARMGQKVDGIIKQTTVDALNVPLQQRIRQILVNMERSRWVPLEPSTDYILVNIPAFTMYVYDKGKLDWSCNVVVGKPGANTVVFSKELRYIVFSPYWNVPPGILSKEVLPGLKRSGAGYLARQNMEIVGASGKVIAPGSINFSKYTNNFPYVVRQKPGGRNSLGKVKFLFPNEYNIYLHDTPARYLFGENKRSFSHGCIRIAEPKHLAQWLLRADSSWTDKKIDEALDAGKEKYATVKDKVPVFIVYFTAFVDSKGKLNFRDDVYGHDARLAATLFGGNETKPAKAALTDGQEKY